MSNGIDLKSLPVLEMVETPRFEDYKLRLVAFVEELKPNIELRESDDFMPLIEAYAYEELQRDIKLNETVKSLLSTSAKLENLDHVCLTNYGTVRQTDESDDDFLTRSLYSLQQSSTTGAEWSYLFHAQSAHKDILDVKVYRDKKSVLDVAQSLVGKDAKEIIVLLNDFLASYATVNVVVYPLNEEIKKALEEKLFDEKIKPMTDNIVISTANIKTYNIEAVIYFERYIDRELFMSEIRAEIEAFKQVSEIAKDVSLSKIYDMLHRDGVDEVDLKNPTKKLIASKNEILVLESYDIRAEWSRDE